MQADRIKSAAFKWQGRALSAMFGSWRQLTTTSAAHQRANFDALADSSRCTNAADNTRKMQMKLMLQPHAIQLMLHPADGPRKLRRVYLLLWPQAADYQLLVRCSTASRAAAVLLSGHRRAQRRHAQAQPVAGLALPVCHLREEGSQDVASCSEAAEPHDARSLLGLANQVCTVQWDLCIARLLLICTQPCKSYVPQKDTSYRDACVSI